MLDPRPGDARPRPHQADPVVAVSVFFIALTAAALLLGGILAVYDWRTPGAETPLVIGGAASFGCALGIPIIAAALRATRSRGR